MVRRTHCLHCRCGVSTVSIHGCCLDRVLAGENQLVALLPLLTTSVYTGMLAAKPLEVKLFRGRNLLIVVKPASDLPGAKPRRTANVVLRCRLAGNSPLPRSCSSQNAKRSPP